MMLRSLTRLRRLQQQQDQTFFISPTRRRTAAASITTSSADGIVDGSGRATTNATSNATNVNYSIVMGPYGIKRIDYNQTIPSKWPLPITPPPPKNQNLIQKYFSEILASIFIGFSIYIYLNADPTVYEYWKRVEQGDVPIDGENDDDDDDDEKFDDDDEELDENYDEWADKKNTTK